MIQLRHARIEESKQILAFYKDIINTTDEEFNPKWNDNYPNSEFIENSIIKKELYIARKDEMIISSVIVNDDFDSHYDDTDWIVNAKKDEIAAIHTFAVNPACRGRGISKRIFDIIKSHCLKNNKKSIRIDVIDGNVGAQGVFKRLGFVYIDTFEVHHDAVGLENFHLYEYVLEWKMGFSNPF